MASAQPVPKVAIVLNTPEMAEITKTPPGRPAARAFYEGMRERGWIHGLNIELVWRSAEQHPERLPAIMDELVRMKVDVIVVSGNRAAREALEKTRTIPIVLGASEFAVEAGLARSYARPGGNVTGLSMMVSHLDAKRIGILKELAPNVSRVAVLGYVDTPTGPLQGRTTQQALEAHGLTGIHVRADRGEDIESAFAEAVRLGANGMVVSSAGIMFRAENQAKIHLLAIKHRIPVLHAVLKAAESGGLAAYSADELAVWHRTGHYVDRILRGERPESMPIEHPTAYHLHLNRKAAAAIGLSIPASILTQADKVFD
jgi:putative ABC transport system substrate-binding protein